MLLVILHTKTSYHQYHLYEQDYGHVTYKDNKLITERILVMLHTNTKIGTGTDPRK
jgi:hypothetical protein